MLRMCSSRSATRRRCRSRRRPSVHDAKFSSCRTLLDFAVESSHGTYRMPKSALKSRQNPQSTVDFGESRIELHSLIFVSEVQSPIHCTTSFHPTCAEPLRHRPSWCRSLVSAFLGGAEHDASFLLCDGVYGSIPDRQRPGNGGLGNICSRIAVPHSMNSAEVCADNTDSTQLVWVCRVPFCSRCWCVGHTVFGLCLRTAMELRAWRELGVLQACTGGLWVEAILRDSILL